MKSMDMEWKDWVGETEKTERMWFIDETYPSKTFISQSPSMNLTRQEVLHLFNFDLAIFPWHRTYIVSKRRIIHDAHTVESKPKHPSTSLWGVKLTTTSGEIGTG
ncbi:hypothetical protein FRC11_002716, partial [Ceratobasidium sp. 423]